MTTTQRVPTRPTRQPAPGGRGPILPETPPRPSPAPTRPSPSRRLVESQLGWIEQVGGMMTLTGRAVAATFTPPYSWTGEFVDESWLLLRRCLLPMIVSTLFFGYGAPGLQAANITSIFGTVDREGAFFVMASVREFSGWITGMVVAGVAGTAICADLGARKIREELDALSTLALDPIREIVTPRFLALGILTPLLNIIALVFGLLGGLLATFTWHETASGYVATFTSNFTLPDLLGSVLKTIGFGFIIAIACCYKGFNVKGGAQGVGRAVNQSVVIAFICIWAFNNLFNAFLLAAYPETGNLH
jgi:phospholipid/cholesterol/gamma-HCH transport system permease protein